MDFGAENINWNCPAGNLLDRLAALLPKKPRLELTVFGSAPLQMLLSPEFLSQDVDVCTAEATWAYLADFIEANNLGPDKSTTYVQVCDPRAFRSASDWRERAVETVRHGHLFRFPHPWDILVSKLQRLEEKDIEAFRLVIQKTGHPTEAELVKHLQMAVDLYRPKFEEEITAGNMLVNTQTLWRILWGKEIDVRAAIIRPALEKGRHDAPPEGLKERLGNLEPGQK